jgi:glycosyltransferase involved in cell wall biosynthesis
MGYAVWGTALGEGQKLGDQTVLRQSARADEAAAIRPAGPAGLDMLGELLDGTRNWREIPSRERALRISVVIPALNEAQNLPFVLPRIGDYVDEVLLVDGRSIDDTAVIARQLHPEIRIVAQERDGKGCALRSGFAAATGDIIVMLDADCSMDPAEMPLFVGALLGGADFVKGSRFIQGAGSLDMTFDRMLGNWGFAKLVRLLFGCRYSDLTYGYIAFWRDVLPRLRLDADGFEIDALMSIRALRAGLKVVEVPSFESARKNGVSHLRTYADGWRMLKMILRERFTRARLEVPVDEASARAGTAVS